MTITVEPSRIRVESRVRNLMNSELRTRRKVGPGPALVPFPDRCVWEPAPRGEGVDSTVVELMA
jgi:hypothetical protein